MEKTIVNTIHIHSSKEKVWDALVNPSKTKIYMFGCETITDWKIGSDLLWEGSYEGQKMVFVKGKVVAYEPHQKLVYTVFDPNGTIEDLPENYLSVTYELEEKDDGTLFTVTQGDYSKVAEGERRYQESYNNGEGWNPILIAIKKLVEGS
ncbi:MAG: SRPBCC domain-containing protein [Bacteroidia bacterium]